MTEIIFYTKDRNVAMKWSDFRLIEKSIYFSVEVTYSIYIGTIECRSSLNDFTIFERELADLYAQKRELVKFLSSDALLSLSLQWKEYGHIHQTYWLKDPQNCTNFLKLNLCFDQSFLIELQENVQKTIEYFNTEKK